MKSLQKLGFVVFALVVLLVTANAALADAGDIEIQEDSIVITVDGVDFDGLTDGDSVNVTPGSEVTVVFEYNNTVATVFETIDVSASTDHDPELTDLPYEDSDLGVTNLLVGIEHEFTFTVPENVVGDDDGNPVTLTLKIVDANDDATVDTVDIELNITRNDYDVFLNSASVSDENLTCTKLTDLVVNLTNTGGTDFKPRIYVFDDEATFDADADLFNDVFDRDPEFGSFTTDDNLVVSDTEEYTVEDMINVSDYNGALTLYVYAVSPLMWTVDDGFYIGGDTTIDITEGSCLDTEALEAVFSIAKNEADATSVDLFAKDDDDNYLYLDEEFSDDIDYEADLVFAIGDDGQTDEDLISCSFAESTLTCDAPTEDDTGSSDLTIDITEGASETSETFTVTVNESIELTDVEVNGEDEDSLNDEAVVVGPGDKVVVSFRVDNQLEEDVTDIVVSLASDAGAFELIFEEDEDTVELNLDGSQTSGTLTLTGTIPANAPAGEETFVLSVTGETLDDDTVTDSFEFDLDVQLEDTELLVEAELVDEIDGTLFCQPDVDFDITITNTGATDEDDVVLVVKEGQTTVFSSADEGNEAIPEIEANGGEHEVRITAPIRGAGQHTLTVEVQYNFAGDKAGTTSQAESVRVTKANCLATFAPDADFIFGLAAEQEHSVTLADDKGNEDLVEWFVDDEEEAQETGLNFVFSSDVAGDFTVKVVYNNDTDDTYSWSHTVTDRPRSNSLTTNIPADGVDISADDLESFENFQVENANAKIVFREPVNLLGILNLDELFNFGAGYVSVDNEPSDLDPVEDRFSAKATVTLKNVPSGKTVIYKFANFGTPANLAGREVCPVNECKPVSHTGGNFVFEVPGFSTYQVVVEKEAALVTPAIVTLADAVRGQTVTTTFTVTNEGTSASRNNILFDTSGINAKYAPVLTNKPNSLNAGQTATVTLQVSVPESESSTLHSIGKILVKSGPADNQTTNTIDVKLSTETFLEVTDIQINGKSSGDFKVGKTNEIEVEVRNRYTEDMDVDIEVTIKNIDDGDDIDESDDGQIRDGDEDKFKFDFDFDGLDIDDDEFTVEIKVEGRADDGSDHEVTVTKRVKLDLKNHDLELDRPVVTSANLQCLRQTNLRVQVNNNGKSDEDDVEIRVSNSALGLDERRTDISIDRFTDNDNSHDETFLLNLQDAPQGTYPITVEVFRKNSKEDTNSEVSVTVQECEQAGSTSRTVSTTGGQTTSQDLLIQQLQQQLAQQLQARQAAAEAPAVESSTTFRTSGTYTALLGVLVVLAFIALVLGVIVAIVKKRP
jgi:hypothetical protein